MSCEEDHIDDMGDRGGEEHTSALESFGRHRTHLPSNRGIQQPINLDLSLIGESSVMLSSTHQLLANLCPQKSHTPANSRPILRSRERSRRYTAKSPQRSRTKFGMPKPMSVKRQAKKSQNGLRCGKCQLTCEKFGIFPHHP